MSEALGKKTEGSRKMSEALESNSKGLPKISEVQNPRTRECLLSLQNPP